MHILLADHTRLFFSTWNFSDDCLLILFKRMSIHRGSPFALFGISIGASRFATISPLHSFFLVCFNFKIAIFKRLIFYRTDFITMGICWDLNPPSLLGESRGSFYKVMANTRFLKRERLFSSFIIRFNFICK